MEQLGSHWTDFHEIWYFSIFFSKSVVKIQVSLKSDKNNGYFTWRPMYIFDHISLTSSWNEMFQTKVVEKIKTHILCSVTFFWKSCRLWDNVEIYCRTRQGTDDNIIRHMRLGCWKTRASYTHSEYVILIAFPRQDWLRERASMLRLYVHCLSCFSSPEQTDFTFLIASPPHFFPCPTKCHVTTLWSSGLYRREVRYTADGGTCCFLIQGTNGHSGKVTAFQI